MALSTKAMRRASRSASAVVKGAEILNYVMQKSNRKKLVQAAKSDIPPVSALSNDLAEKFKPEIHKAIVKQFVGLCVRTALEEEGFEVSRTGVRLHKDKIFTTGSTYRPKGEGGDQAQQSDDAIERMMAALSEQQALRAAQALERAFPGVLQRARAR